MTLWKTVERNPPFGTYVNFQGFSSRPYKTDSGIMDNYNPMCTIRSTAVSVPLITPTSQSLSPERHFEQQDHYLYTTRLPCLFDSLLY